MDNRPIGVFDSGLGGLTSVRELQRVLPNESIVYFGDTGRVPYGSRSDETILKYTQSDIRFLRSFDIKMIIVACGTASTVALPHIHSDVPLLGVVEPAVRRASAVTANGKIGVIGTQGTISSKKYEAHIRQINPKLEVHSAACPLFVPLVESGWLTGDVARLTAEAYLEPLKKAKVDTLILGCTHYPLLRQTISAVMGPEVTLVDPGAETALYAKEQLSAAGQLSSGPQPDQYRYYVSDSVRNFSEIAGIFLHTDISGLVQQVDIEQYERENPYGR